MAALPHSRGKLIIMRHLLFNLYGSKWGPNIDGSPGLISGLTDNIYVLNSSVHLVAVMKLQNQHI